MNPQGVKADGPGAFSILALGGGKINYFRGQARFNLMSDYFRRRCNSHAQN